MPNTRYQLDTTGININNLVINEPHTLINKPVRVLVPLYGPFYSESLVIYDTAINRLLIKDIDFKIAGLLQEATLRFGKEICEVIVITNSSINTSISITYQTLGGLYQNNIDNLVTMYTNLLNDNRDVDWTTGLLNKPMTFPPSDHTHVIQDWIGFQPIVTALERVANAVTLRNV